MRLFAGVVLGVEVPQHNRELAQAAFSSCLGETQAYQGQQGIKQVFPERNSLAFLVSSPSPALNEVTYLPVVCHSQRTSPLVYS